MSERDELSGNPPFCGNDVHPLRGVEVIQCIIRLSPKTPGLCGIGRAKIALAVALEEENIKVAVIHRLHHHSFCVMVQKGVFQFPRSPAAWETVRRCSVLCFDSIISNSGKLDLGRIWEQKRRTPLSCPILHPFGVSVSFFSLASLPREKNKRYSQTLREIKTALRKIMK